jgi:hypothetical protein
VGQGSEDDEQDERSDKRHDDLNHNVGDGYAGNASQPPA